MCWWRGYSLLQQKKTCCGTLEVEEFSAWSDSLEGRFSIPAPLYRYTWCIHWHGILSLFLLSLPFSVHCSFLQNLFSLCLLSDPLPFIHQCWRLVEDNCPSPALRKQVTCFWVGLGVPMSPLHFARPSSSTTLLFSLSRLAPWRQSLRLQWGCSVAATAALLGPPSPSLLPQAPVTSWARLHAPRKLPVQALPLFALLVKRHQHPWEGPWLIDQNPKFLILEEKESETEWSFKNPIQQPRL